MRPSHRAERLADELRVQLGQLISRMRDPRVGFATVTGVRLSPDLRHARVQVSVLGGEEAQQQSLRCLEAAAVTSATSWPSIWRFVSPQT